MEKENLNLYQKLQKVRKELSETKLKKTGHNKFQNFDYFQLEDFVPTATKLFDKYGLTPIFNIKKDTDGEEVAELVITDGESVAPIVFRCPTAQPNTKGQDAIQLLGSKVTYMRRYLYLMALDITEADGIDSRDQKTEVDTTPMCTENQFKEINSKAKILTKEELMSYKIGKPSDIKKLTLEKASEIIKQIHERENANGTQE